MILRQSRFSFFCFGVVIYQTLIVAYPPMQGMFFCKKIFSSSQKQLYKPSGEENILRKHLQVKKVRLSLQSYLKPRGGAVGSSLGS